MDPDVDGAIARALAGGDLAEAATLAIRAYGPQILGFLVALVRDEDRARDAFSLFSEDLWLGLPQFRGEGAFRAWAYRIARNAALRVLRDPYVVRGRRFDTGESADLAAAIRSTTQAHLRPSAPDKLARLREALTPDEHALLILRVDRDLPWSEIAVALGEGKRSEETALRKRFERLTAKLRRLAADEGLLT